MSTKALVTTLIVFAVLVGIAVLLNQGGPQKVNSATSTTPLLQIDAAKIEAIEVRPADAPPALVRRTDAGGWVFVAGDLEWPVAADAPNAMLRLLSNLTGSDPGSDAAAIGDRACSIALTLDDGTTRTLTMSQDTIGGRTPARVDGGDVVLIDAELLNAATAPGPRGWRISQALPGAGPVDTSRLTIETPEAGISLARVEGVWQMRAPVGARADEQAVAGLLRSLGEIRAEAFLDAPDTPRGSVSGLDSPRMVVTAERDRRLVDAAGRVTVLTSADQLRIGGPASADGSTVYAAPDAAPSFVMVLRDDPTTSIPTSPRHYLATTATGVRPSDVWVVVVQPDSGAQFGRRRHLDQWLNLNADGSTSDAERAPVDELLAFLAQTPGEPDIATGEVRSLAKVDLLDSEGGLLDRITIGYTADGQLAARSGRIIWTYPDAAAPALLAVPSFADLPAIAPRPDAPPTDPASPINKPK